MRQTNARVFAGDTHAENKIVSLFEPSTEVIRKSLPPRRRGARPASPPNSAKSSNCRRRRTRSSSPTEGYDRRPSDSDLLLAAIETHQATLGCTPHLVAADAGFSSANNEAAAKAKGVKRLCIPNRSTKGPERKTRAKEALVPQRPEMADRLRGSHQRGQTTARTGSQPVQGGGRNQALGRPRGDCRQPGQHQPRHGQAAQPVIPLPIPLPLPLTSHLVGGDLPVGPRAQIRCTVVRKRLFAPESS